MPHEEPPLASSNSPSPQKRHESYPCTKIPRPNNERSLETYNSPAPLYKPGLSVCDTRIYTTSWTGYLEFSEESITARGETPTITPNHSRSLDISPRNKRFFSTFTTPVLKVGRNASEPYHHKPWVLHKTPLLYTL